MMRKLLFLCILSLLSLAYQLPQSWAIENGTAYRPNKLFHFDVDTMPLPEGVFWTKNEFIQSHNKFTLKLFSLLNDQNAGNQVISPYSISAAMGMVFLGSAGTSEQEIGKVFGWNNNTQQLHKIFAEYNSSIKSLNGDGLMLNLANRVCVQATTSLTNQYNSEIKKYHSAEVESYNSNKIPAAVKDINNWVENRTNKKIHNIVDEKMLTSASMVLVNAIYFKGLWVSAFEEKNTVQEPFFLEDNTTTSASFMKKKQFAKSYQDAEVTVVELVYRPGSVSMILVLPQPNLPLKKLIANLNIDSYTKWVQNLHLGEAIISLPKWQTETKVALPKVLSDMGMPSCFDKNKADFSRMTGKKDLYIGSVIHQTVITVSETGTEAAAATTIEMTSRGGGKPLEFIANRPFLYFIKENQNNTILFMGQVYNPTL